jgi:hypothetical protein
MSERKFDVVNVNVYRVGPPSLIVVDWVWEESTIPASHYTLDIYRGESPTELDRIAKGLPADQYSFYEDRIAYIKDKHRTYYYQVKACNKKTGKVITSEISTWEGELDYVGLYIVEEHDFLFEFVAGMPMLVLKKVTAGKSRCGDCWDKIAKRVIRSNCRTCHGTGWVGDGVGGYYDPVYTYADFSPDPEQIGVTTFGKVQSNQTQIFMTNYPRMSVGDLVIELLTGKRWKVSQLRDTEKNRSKMLQFVVLDEIEKGDIEYKIDIDTNYIERAREEINERKSQPEF